MNLHSITLLLCLSFSLHAMDPNAYEQLKNKQNNTLTIHQKNDLKRLYSITYDCFQHLTTANPMRYINLIAIISATDHLKKQDLTEDDISKFAFKRKDTMQDKIREELQKPPYNSTTYISVFFARLAKYNALLSTQNLTTPSLDQCYQYEHNLLYNNAATKAQLFNLDISETINAKKLITTLPSTVAAAQFYDLLQDTCKLRTEDPEAILTIASVLCLPADRLQLNIDK